MKHTALKHEPLTWNSVPGNGNGKVAILGAPSDLGSTSNGTGCADFPDVVRRCMWLPQIEGVVDVGNVQPAGHSAQTYAAEVATHMVDLYSIGFKHVVLIGGDDSVTAGAVWALRTVRKSPSILEHWDAHSDTDGGTIFDHSTWMAHVADDLDETASRQFGMRTYLGTPTYDSQTKHQPQVFGIDLDVIDPAFAPGVTVPMPFGVHPDLVQRHIVQWRPTKLRPTAFVVTEGNPSRDVNDMTARLAFVLIHLHLLKYLQ